MAKLSFLYKVAFSVSIGAVLLVYLSEILTSREIGLVYSIRSMINVSIGLCSLVSVDLIGLSGNYLIYGISCFLIGLLLWLDMHETKGLTRDEIKDLYLGVHDNKIIAETA